MGDQAWIKTISQALGDIHAHCRALKRKKRNLQKKQKKETWTSGTIEDEWHVTADGGGFTGGDCEDKEKKQKKQRVLMPHMSMDSNDVPRCLLDGDFDTSDDDDNDHDERSEAK